MIIEAPIKRAENDLMARVDSSLFAQYTKPNTAYSNLDLEELDLLRSDIQSTIHAIEVSDPQYLIDVSEQIGHLQSDTTKRRYSDIVYDDFGIIAGRRKREQGKLEMPDATVLLTEATRNILTIRRLGEDIALCLNTSLSDDGFKSVFDTLNEFYSLKRIIGTHNIESQAGYTSGSKSLKIFRAVIEGLGIDLNELNHLNEQKTNPLRRAYDMKLRVRNDFLRKMGDGNLTEGNNRANRLIRKHFPNLREVYAN
jgi:hypothetical protein